jgi:phosphoglycerate dehydrogenase-like enzyme
MMNDAPIIGIVVAPGEEMPPGLDDIASEVQLALVRTGEELEHIIDRVSVLAVYDFRTRLLHEADLGVAVHLEWIHAASAGVDAVLAPGVLEQPIVVTNSRGVFDTGIAEYVLGLMLYFAKDLATTLALQRERRWEHRNTLMLRGQRLVIVGAGSIGKAIAKAASAIGMWVEGIAREEREDPVFGLVHPVAELHNRLGHADFVATAAPLTQETRGMFDRRAFEAMKPGSWLINVGRGPIVVESALIDALEAGRLAGAGLDVFEEEPLPAGSPLWDMPNVVVSPHMAGDVVGWEEELGALLVDNVRRWRAGEELRNVIDKDKEAALRQATAGSEALGHD